MHYALRLSDPYSQRFDIGYAFVNCAVRLRIPHSLIEQVNKVIEQGILVIHVECQYAVKESRHVVEIIFPYFFAAVAVANKQANVAQGLAWVGEAWDIAALDNAPEHEAQGRSAFFRLKVVLGEVATVSASTVAFSQCAQTAKVLSG
jgi:hypothetical protein